MFGNSFKISSSKFYAYCLRNLFIFLLILLLTSSPISWGNLLKLISEIYLENSLRLPTVHCFGNSVGNIFGNFVENSVEVDFGILLRNSVEISCGKLFGNYFGNFIVFFSYFLIIPSAIL